MKRLLVALFSLLVLASQPALAAKGTAEQRRAEIKAMRAQTLQELFHDIPDAQEVLENAWGYAVFSNTGMNLLLFSTARGAGVLRDHRDGTDQPEQDDPHGPATLDEVLDYC